MQKNGIFFQCEKSKIITGAQLRQYLPKWEWLMTAFPYFAKDMKKINKFVLISKLYKEI